tara:strand:+ start:1656 stop:2033 length:378 start_codon:yes stop_codon:yes gene_type:complete
MNIQQRVDAAMRQIAETKGFTDIEGRCPTWGYSVGGYGLAAVFPYQPKELQNVRLAIYSELEHVGENCPAWAVNIGIGGWVSGGGAVVIDVITHHENLREALLHGIARGEQSIWDFKNKAEITLR